MASEQPKPSREELENQLVGEIQKTIDYLERALQEAPDDEALKKRMAAILDQARSMRDKVKEVIERAKQRRAGEQE
jgi:division protein CdvB (Snf7/Vps24/ESCRT-III family)